MFKSLISTIRYNLAFRKLRKVMRKQAITRIELQKVTHIDISSSFGLRCFTMLEQDKTIKHIDGRGGIYR